MKKNKNITCRIFLIFGLIILSHPAFAEEVKPEFSAIVCLEPASGREMILESPDAACPPDLQYFRLYKLKKVEAKALPRAGLPYPHHKEKQKETPDAASGQK